jgi:hypothetical protein
MSTDDLRHRSHVLYDDGPGMREMLGVTAALVGAGLGESVALVSSAAEGAVTRPRRNGGG